MSYFIFPLRQRPSLSYKDGGRQFGADRPGGRKNDVIIAYGNNRDSIQLTVTSLT
jgi:hypothetical protein